MQTNSGKGNYEKIMLKTLQLLQQNPDLLDVLKEIVEYEAELQAENKMWRYWEWADVGVAPHIIRKIATYGILDVYSTARRREYKLKNWKAVKDAIELYEAEEALKVKEVTSTRIPDDLFDIIEGYDDIKKLLKDALQADDPVHVLFVGPPSTGKTLFLLEISRLPNSKMFLGGSTTRVGFQEWILMYKPKYIVIDELDKMRGEDYTALLSIAETGIVMVDKHRRHKEEHVKVWLFGAANRIDRIPWEVRSRFLSIHLKEYDKPTFIKVAQAVLTRRENIDEDVAKYIAEKIADYTKDVRDAIRIGRLCKNKDDPKKYVDWLIDIMKKYSWKPSQTTYYGYNYRYKRYGKLF